MDEESIRELVTEIVSEMLETNSDPGLIGWTTALGPYIQIFFAIVVAYSYSKSYFKIGCCKGCCELELEQERDEEQIDNMLRNEIGEI